MACCAAHGQLAIPTDYAQNIQPLFTQYCAGCHSGNMPSGGLLLDSAAGLFAGGDTGAALVPSNPFGSELLKRMRLSTDSEDHMPPLRKAQPSEAQIRVIEQWILSGAKTDTPASGPAREVAQDPKTKDQPKNKPKPPAASPSSIAAVRERLIHIEPDSPGSSLLMIDCAPVAGRITASDLVKLLTPLREQVAELSISKMTPDDALIELIAHMPNLIRLNVSRSQFTDAHAATFSANESVETLIATQTPLTDAAASSLAKLKSLKRVYLWKSDITDAGVAVLAARSIAVDRGVDGEIKPLETEVEVKFTGDAPLPQAAPAPAAALAADALKPRNTVCPVSGKPVNADFAVVYKGRVIGFCCKNCVAAFYENPDAIAAKVP
jgi:YHS domain-containing protein/mono/diheme cytochrome c family protein